MTSVPSERVDESEFTPPARVLSPSGEKRQKNYKYYDFIMAAFVTVMLCSNFISARKQVGLDVGGHVFVFGAGVLFFPISYLFGDILTEVYGYARSRKVVWAGFAALGFAAFMSWVVVSLPPAPGWKDQELMQRIFGSSWRIVLASMMGFFTGEFVNSFVLAKLKIFTRGRFLWVRTIGSTLLGEMADSLIFYPVAFLGIWSTDRVILVLFTNYTLKVLWEVVATPLTYAVVGFLKRAEHEDYYDVGTDFTPFSLET